MIKKINIQINFLDTIFLFIFSFFLFAILYGPSMINLFFLFLFTYFIFNLIKKKIEIDKNDLLLFTFPVLFWIYLVLNSTLINSEFSQINKSFFFIRFFLISFMIYKILIHNKNYLKYISIIFTIFSITLSLDIIYQYLNGYDFFGYKAGLCVYPDGKYDPKNCERFSGFFGDEYIAGNYLSTFGIFCLVILYNFIKKDIISKIFFISSILLIILAILIAGERNAILTLFLIFFFNLFFNFKIRKYLFLISMIFIIISAFAFKNFSHIKYRYLDWPVNYMQSQEGNYFQKFIQTPWGIHYITSHAIFKDNIFFGSGVKSFREICKKEEYQAHLIFKKYGIEKEKVTYYGCSTHPHNFYLEILSETGLIGFIIFITLLYFIIFHNLIINKKKITDYPQLIFALSIVCSMLFPLKPTGSFTATVFATNVWICIGFFLYFVKKTE